MKRKAESEDDPSAGASEPQLPSSLKLYYFNIKGKGEPIRLICSYSGLKLDDHRFASRDEFIALKESSILPFGQVPMLEVKYGGSLENNTKKTDDEESSTSANHHHKIVQSATIMRFLGKITGLYPTTLSEDELMLATKIDALLDQETDAFTGVTVLTYSQRFGLDLTDEQKDSSYELVNTETLPKHLWNVEKVLSMSKSGWLADTAEPSICDFVWACRLQSLASKKELSTKIQNLEDFPNLKAFVDKFFDLKQIKDYYEKEARNA